MFDCTATGYDLYRRDYLFLVCLVYLRWYSVRVKVCYAPNLETKMLTLEVRESMESERRSCGCCGLPSL